MKKINYTQDNNAIANALQLGVEEGFIKIGRLQRQLRLGYQKAKQLVGTMEEKELLVPFERIKWKIVNKKIVPDMSK